MNNTSESGNLSQQTPGQMIKAARESKQISVSEVVQKLLLSKQVVIAIEDDDYSKISAQVYAEGYLKAYAKFLQIPVDTVLKSFRSLHVYTDVENTVNTGVKPQVENRLNLNLTHMLENQRIRFILLGLCGVLILSILLFFIIKLSTVKSTEITTAQMPVVTTVSTESGATEQTSADIVNLDIPSEKQQDKNNTTKNK